MTTNEIQSLITRHHITPWNLHSAAPTLRINRVPAGKAEQAKLVKEIAAVKPEIIAYFLAQEAEREAEAARWAEITEKASRIPGLSKIRAAMETVEQGREDLIRQFESESGCTRWPLSSFNAVNGLCTQYPVAAAYIRAEQYSLADNDRKAAAGRAAMVAIAEGSDHKAAIEKMVSWADDINPWD